MKENSKTVLTKKNHRTILTEMPVETPDVTPQKRSKNKSSRTKQPPLQDQYNQFFVAAPLHLWRGDDNNFSLEQPSPYKWIPSETTYGIDVTMCPIPDA